MTKTAAMSSPIDYYHSLIYYTPSEIVVYPCKGKPTLLLDEVSPKSHPAAGDFTY